MTHYIYKRELFLEKLAPHAKSLQHKIESLGKKNYDDLLNKWIEELVNGKEFLMHMKDFYKKKMMDGFKKM